MEGGVLPLERNGHAFAIFFFDGYFQNFEHAPLVKILMDSMSLVRRGGPYTFKCSKISILRKTLVEVSVKHAS